jgi:hypothetical protein
MRKFLKRAARCCAAVCLLAPAMAMAQISASSTRVDDDSSVGMMDVLAADGLLQEPPTPVAQPETPPATMVTVHGLVLNAASGEPLPRALVKVDSVGAIGALTDGEGKFEIAGVPTGTQTFEVVKPGFGGKGEVGSYVIPDAHTVEVAEEMRELKFSLRPLNAVYGQVTLSTGEAGVAIGLVLLRKTIDTGHASWTEAERRQTSPEGEFRFSGLEDGTYALMTEPAFDNDRAAAPDCNGQAPAEMAGYAAMFYGGATNVAGAAQIVLAGGQASQTNLVLSLTLFHEVKVTPLNVPTGEQWQFQSSLINPGGVASEYPLREDGKTHVLCGYLPNGNYTVMTTASTNEPMEPNKPLSQQEHKPKAVAGMIEFSMENHAEMRLRLPLSNEVSTPIRIRYEPGPPKPLPTTSGNSNDDELEALGDPEPLALTAMRADGVGSRGEGQWSAEWVDNELYEMETMAPGSYWLQGSPGRPGVCLGTVSAGGQSLAHTPWTVGAAGTGTGIDVVLRTDCAKLKLKAPASATADAPGEDQSLYFYAVPEFDSIGEANEGVLQRVGNSSQDLVDLTPGTYRVFVFDSPHPLEYRTAGELDRLAGEGQEVTLEPGGSATLVLEMPGR